MRKLHVILFIALTQIGMSAANLQVATFETDKAADLKLGSDTSVSTKAVTLVKNDLDGSQAAEVSAELIGPDAGWTGLTLPVQTKAAAVDDPNVVRLQARAVGNSTSLYVTITEKDGSRWNANIHLDETWQNYEIQPANFTWFMGPQNRKSSRPRFDNIASIDPWVSGIFQGKNGFAIDNVHISSIAPKVTFRLIGKPGIPLQEDSTLEIESVHATRKYSGEIHTAVADRTAALVPEKVLMQNGRATIPIFARKPGPLKLSLFDPLSNYEQCIDLSVERKGLYTQFTFPGFEGEQLIFASQAISPSLKIEGSTSVPLSAHIEVKDHSGRVLVSQNENTAQLVADQGKLTLPNPGLMTVEIKLIAEPLTALPRASQRNPLPLIQAQEIINVATPDGVTTAVTGGYLLHHDALPTTATVLGQDRFPVFAAILSPNENTRMRSPFGIGSGELFHLSDADILTTGEKRLRWHRKLGSLWARNDLWWDNMELTSGTWYMFKADDVVDAYKKHRLRLLGILNYASAWDKNAPATPEMREKWAGYVQKIADTYGDRLTAFEVWNEPNGTFWEPAPDVNAYRELLKVTHGVLNKTLPHHPIVAGALANYDPVFLEGMFADGYGQYFDHVSFHPYPERHHGTPEDTDLDRKVDGMNDIIRKNGGNRQLWITELGWPTTPGGVSEMEQANFMTRAYATALAKGVSKLFWFNLVDSMELPWHGSTDNHLGMLDYNYHFKPSAVAYNLLEFMMAHMDPKEYKRIRDATICSFNILLQRYKWPGIMHIAWTNRAGQEQDVEIDMVSGGPVYAFDYLGAQRHGQLVRIAPPPTSTETNATSTTGTAKIPPYKDVKDTSGFPELERMVVSAGDILTTRTYRYRLTHEPLYIWDSGAEPPKRVNRAH